MTHPREKTETRDIGSWKGRTLREFSIPTVEGCSQSITRPPVKANNFEIKLTIIFRDMWYVQA